MYAIICRPHSPRVILSYFPKARMGSQAPNPLHTIGVGLKVRPTPALVYISDCNRLNQCSGAGRITIGQTSVYVWCMNIIRYF
jgi:hypothetical protein